MDLEKEFIKLGGKFLTPSNQIISSLAKIKAFVFDWDGVFNDGRKTGDSGSSFSEVDSMGINLLRFDFWLRNNYFPKVFILTGMKNESASEFSKREHFDGIFLNAKNKIEPFKDICSNYMIAADEVAFIFDDILDIEVAKVSGLSFFVGRKSNPLLTDYIIQNEVCNYISGFSGQNHAVREICELIIGLSGDYRMALELRIEFKGKYEDYLLKRNLVSTDVVSIQ